MIAGRRKKVFTGRFRNIFVYLMILMAAVFLLYNFSLQGKKVEEIPTQSWKKYFNITSNKLQKDRKKLSVEKAMQLSGNDFILPGCKVPEHNVAEAFLIAEYGRRKEELR